MLKSITLDNEAQNGTEEEFDKKKNFSKHSFPFEYRPLRVGGQKQNKKKVIDRIGKRRNTRNQQ